VTPRPILRRPTTKWELPDGRTLNLVHEDDLVNIPFGITMTSILGEEAVVGKDPMDMDTRGGYTAWGFVAD
jgi:hypothetical protein